MTATTSSWVAFHERTVHQEHEQHIYSPAAQTRAPAPVAPKATTSSHVIRSAEHLYQYGSHSCGLQLAVPAFTEPVQPAVGETECKQPENHVEWQSEARVLQQDGRKGAGPYQQSGNNPLYQQSGRTSSTIQQL